MQITGRNEAESETVWRIWRGKVTHIAGKSEWKTDLNRGKLHFQAKFMASEFLFGEKIKACF